MSGSRSTDVPWPGDCVSARPLRDLLAATTTALGSRSEARWIVASAAGMSDSDLVLRLDTDVAPTTSDAVRAMVARRLGGEPLQYVLGTWGFRMLDIGVDRRVLIPRPETEQVVQAALDELSTQARRVDAGSSVVAVDLGTGSGVIALSLAVEFPASGPALEVWATDVSADAVDRCTENVAVLARRSPDAASRVRVAGGSWFDALPADLAGHVQLVVSNPPYVSQAEWEVLEPAVRDHEPVGALVAGPNGLEAIEVLLDRAPRWLAPGGSVVVEIAPGQAHDVATAASALGYLGAEIRHDLSGRERMFVARSPGR